ncbi:hypothetical protein C8Q77DRAFT_1216727 [Trametes polyzona]|nr:hypothetical protein C8Q77DRAFT_1216727 [Trametes polyzona]
MASRRGRFRTKLCRNYALGHCPQGDGCNYVHASPAAIQSDLNIHAMLDSGTSPYQDSRTSLATAPSPVWSTISPVTNNSDRPNYHLGLSPVSGSTPASRIKYRPLSWRTALCRHYMKNKGWCPLGDECNYIHDLALAQFAKDDVRMNDRRTPRQGEGRKFGKGKAGSKQSHCWAYVQGLCHVHDCQYLHPVAVHLFAQHTPCLAWPNCRRGPLCPYKHPEPYISDTPPASPVNAHVPPQAVSQSDNVPRGAYPHNGMLYFNNAQSLPQPPQLPSPLVLPRLPQPPVALPNPWELWGPAYPPTPLAYMPVMVSPQHVWQSVDNSFRWPSVDDAASLPPPPLARPTQPTLDVEHHTSSPSTSANYTYEPAHEHARDSSLPNPDDDLPYVPSKQRQVGHARRVSVTIKGKEDLDALGIDSSTHGRLPWQTHGDRLGRRVSKPTFHGVEKADRSQSWAPTSSPSMHHVPGALTPPAALHGM